MTVAEYRRCPLGVRTEGIRPRRPHSDTVRSETWNSTATSLVRNSLSPMVSGAPSGPNSSSSS